MKIYKCGTRVVLELPQIEGVITAFFVRFGQVQYEVTYFVEGVIKEVVIDESLFYTGEKQTNIGFK